MQKEYDLVVLGTGGAGFRVAMQTREVGWRVAAIDEGPFGGTCAIRGCIPKKILAGTAEVMDLNRHLMQLDIITNPQKLNWQSLIQFKNSFTDPVPQRTINKLKKAGIDIYEGPPKFIGNIEIAINDQVIKAKMAHIAVGAKPAKLPIDGFEYLITSDDFLNLLHLPKEIIFVGGGYVSFEFAHIAARFNAKVTILHKDQHPLNKFDEDLVKQLLAYSKDIGITIELNSRVKKIEKNGDVYKVICDNDKTYAADLVVHGAGRPPAIADLNLEAVDVKYDVRKGIQVNDYLQTTNPNIYAAGDAVASGPPLSPIAVRQGRVVANNLLGKLQKQQNYFAVPSVVFTSPPLAKVGFLEAELRAKNSNFDVIIKDLSAWLDNQRFNIQHAMSKIFIEKQTKKILGAHIFGHHAEEMINIFGLALELGLTTDQLQHPIFAFPTAGDDVRAMF